MTIMAEQETTYALSDLVARRKGELKISYRTIADRGIDPETGEQELRHAWVHRLANREPVIVPQLPQLRALAVALDYPLRPIQDAAGEQFLGIHSVALTHSGDIRALLDQAQEMSEEDLARLLRLAETFRSTSRPPTDS